MDELEVCCTEYTRQFTEEKRIRTYCNCIVHKSTELQSVLIQRRTSSMVSANQKPKFGPVGNLMTGKLLFLYLLATRPFLVYTVRTTVRTYGWQSEPRMAVTHRLTMFALMGHPCQPFRAGPVPLLTALDAVQVEQESLLISSIRVIPQSALQLRSRHCDTVCHHLAPQLSNAGYARDAVKRQRLNQLEETPAVWPHFKHTCRVLE